MNLPSSIPSALNTTVEVIRKILKHKLSIMKEVYEAKVEVFRKIMKQKLSLRQQLQSEGKG